MPDLTREELVALRDAEKLRLKIFENHDNVMDTVVVTGDDYVGYRVWATDERAAVWGGTSLYAFESAALKDALTRARAGRWLDFWRLRRGVDRRAESFAERGGALEAGPRGTLLRPNADWLENDSGPTFYDVFTSPATDEHGFLTDHIGVLLCSRVGDWTATTPHEVDYGRFPTRDEALTALLDAAGGSPPRGVDTRRVPTHHRGVS